MNDAQAKVNAAVEVVDVAKKKAAEDTEHSLANPKEETLDVKLGKERIQIFKGDPCVLGMVAQDCCIYIAPDIEEEWENIL